MRSFIITIAIVLISSFTFTSASYSATGSKELKSYLDCPSSNLVVDQVKVGFLLGWWTTDPTAFAEGDLGVMMERYVRLLNVIMGLEAQWAQDLNMDKHCMAWSSRALSFRDIDNGIAERNRSIAEYLMILRD